MDGFILVKEEVVENATKSGLILGASTDTSYMKGEVVASGVKTLQTGDIAIFHRDAKIDINETGDTLWIVKDEALLAKLS